MTTRVTVLGAGYSGLVAAQQITKYTNAEVTLVNARDEFVERVRLHQVATGQPVRKHRITDLIGKRPVRLAVDEVTAIDVDARQVHLAGGEPIEYDLLVYALGSRSDVDGVPGVAEHAYPLAVAEDAALLAERLVATTGTVTVIGGGLTGIEAATEIAESYPDHQIQLVTAGRLGDGLSDRGRAHLRRVFDRLGIEVVEDAAVAKVHADDVELEDGTRLPSATVVWTAGFTVGRLAADAGLAVDANGRMLVDGALRSVSHPEVYGIGDAAAARRNDGQELRMACATGLPAAGHVARAIGRHAAGEPAGHLRFRYVNQCISLGRKDGLVQYVRADDSPVGAVLTGRLAAKYKELIVRSALTAQRRPWMVRLAAGGG